MDRATLRQRIGKSADTLVFVTAILMFAATFARGVLLGPAQVVVGALGTGAMHHLVQRIIALLLIVAALNLRRRKKAAWVLSVVLLSASLALSLVARDGIVSLIVVALKAYALWGLIIARDYYQRPSERTTLRQAALLALFIMGVVIANVLIGQLLLHLRLGTQPLALGEILSWLGNTIIGNATGIAPRYSQFAFGVFWAGVATCLLLILRSATIERIITRDEHDRARDLVLRYGQNPASYLTLSDDKQLFFGRGVDGVIAYGIVGDTVVVFGDPVCAPADFVLLLAQFHTFCEEVASGCIFTSTTGLFLEQYRAFGYGTTKCGEEAFFDLTSYDMSGSAAMKARQKVRHARRAGVTVSEYRPTEHRDHALEAAIAAVSSAWVTGKKSRELRFSVGDNALADPADRRYFIARDAEGRVCAYNVFLPYASGKGWLVDVTRRLPSAPNGVTELLVWEGFQTFRSEGALYGSMGLAPLANLLDEAGEGSSDEKLLNQFYERFNRFYGFKDLYAAKKKYGPTEWRPGYFVLSGRRLSPQLLYAVIAIQSPEGIREFAKNLLPQKMRGGDRAVS